MGKVNEVMKKHGVSIKRGEAGQHRAQAIVEIFNRTLAERLFGPQYAQEILLEARGGKNVRSTEWVSRLPDVQGESKRTGPYGKKILKIDVDMIFEKLVSGF